MWVFTKYGFVSVVQKDEDNVMVRARARSHLTNLLQFDLGGEKIVRSPRADYEYRIIVRREVWARVMSQMVKELDYTNFKEEAGKRVALTSRGYINALHSVWDVMWQALNRV